MQRYNYFLIKILSSGKIIKTIVYYPIVETGRAPSHHPQNKIFKLPFSWFFAGPPPVSTTRYFF